MTSDGLTLGLLAESALRSLMLGALVFVLLKLARLRDLRTETAIWTVVLVAALSMPLLTLWQPAGIAVTLPRLAPAPLSSTLHISALVSATQATSSQQAASRLFGWTEAHAGPLLWGSYVLVALAGLTRLATGLVLTLELYRAAEPINEDWARGKAVRASAAISGPLSFAHCILLPSSYRSWSDAKRLAVMAHEESHIRRGDFFIQLLASVHRALFWFSPFAWWLQHRLGELAETASDNAAIDQINDAAGYAEILLEVARQAQPWRATVAMARGPGVTKRIEHILSGARERSLGAAGRIASLSLVLAASLAFAQVHAAIAPAPSSSLTRVDLLIASKTTQTARSQPHAMRASSSRHKAKSEDLGIEAATPPAPEADFTYNPRALLDEPDAEVLPVAIFSGARARAATERRPVLQGE